MVIESIAACFYRDIHDEEQAYFGACPTQEDIDNLEKWGVDVIVNLTFPDEKKLSVYTTTKKLISWPIPDRAVPDDKVKFCALVLYLVQVLNRGKKVFIHCKGGHGRAGLVTAAVLVIKHNLDVKDAIELTTEYHSERTCMRQYWRRVGSPQTTSQKKFLHSIFRQHTISTESPFYTTDFKEPYLESFLFQTYLGDIVGEKGHRLKLMRKSMLLVYGNF